LATNVVAIGNLFVESYLAKINPSVTIYSNLSVFAALL